MAGFQSQRYCEECGRKRLHVKADLGSSHAKHMLMAAILIFTCFLAFPVVIIWGLIDHHQRANQKWHCQVCGSVN